MPELLTLTVDGLPPTVNQMYRSSGVHRYKQQAVADWQEDVASQMAAKWNNPQNNFSLGVPKAPYTKRAAVGILFTVNDNRRWDIDNRIKVLLDCLEMGGVLQDDSQIDSLGVVRKKGVKTQTTIILMELRKGECRQ